MSNLIKELHWAQMNAYQKNIYVQGELIESRQDPLLWIMQVKEKKNSDPVINLNT